MISELEVVALVAPLQADVLQRWIDQGWVLPHYDGTSQRFDVTDVARVRLICELHYELRIEEDSLSLVLSLMDQLYATRRALRDLASAVEAQPADVRERIASLAGTGS
jgi:chaperone modulatory protein CbpM